MAVSGSVYSINDLEKLTGIRKHTIRIWEQRFKLLSPKRTETNIRYYNSEDLRLLLNISLLNNKGFRISSIAGMNEMQVEEKVKQLTSKEEDPGSIHSALIKSMLDFDELTFSSNLEKSISNLGLETSFEKILLPFFEKMGILWQANAINPAQEHFASNLVRQKLLYHIDELPVIKRSSKPRLLLFLPESELHEISLLFLLYFFRKRKFPVLYLGQSVPLNSLQRAMDLFNPDHILTKFITPVNLHEFEEIIETLRNFSTAKIWVSGRAVPKGEKNVERKFNRYDSPFELLKKLG